MNFRKTLEKFNKNEYLVFILILVKIFDFIKPVFKSFNINAATYYSSYDWFGLVVQIITIILLYIVLRKNRKLGERIDGDKAERQQWIVSNGNLERDKMIYFATSLQVLVAYINSFKTNEEEIKRLSNIFSDANINIQDCEKIGLDKTIIAYMLTTYYSKKSDEQNEVLNRVYPPKES